MSEKIFNVFLPFDNAGRCNHALYVSHDTMLDDKAAIRFLRDKVETDFLQATRVSLGKSFDRAMYEARCRIGAGHHLYDEVFQTSGASHMPLFVTTLVIEGRPRVDIDREHGDPDFYLSPDVIGDAHMDDWLLKYRKGDKIDLPQLINDDYFLAVKLTFNTKHYVSSLKLILSCIDSISYIEYGDQKTLSFIDWLRNYADLTKIGVTPEELWELRNGVLHMTNLSSRQVTRNKVRRISVSIGRGGQTDADGTYYFDFHELMHAIAAALGNWLASYNKYPEKFADFVQRYDETISDSRFLLKLKTG